MRIVGHGIDIVEIARIGRMLNDHGDRFIERCFTSPERSYCESSAVLRAERYAVRFAAKEAVFKALGTGWRGGISWTDVEVGKDALGAPRIALDGRSREMARQRGIDQWHLSLSHSRGLAIASVIAACSH